MSHNRTPTFAEFQASRVEVPDLGTYFADFNDASWSGGPPGPGFIYMQDLYISQVTEDWPDAAREQGKYHLILGRDDWISDDLEALARRLHAWAVAEDYTLQFPDPPKGAGEGKP